MAPGPRGGNLVPQSLPHLPLLPTTAFAELHPDITTTRASPPPARGPGVGPAGQTGTCRGAPCRQHRPPGQGVALPPAGRTRVCAPPFLFALACLFHLNDCSFGRFSRLYFRALLLPASRQRGFRFLCCRSRAQPLGLRASQASHFPFLLMFFRNYAIPGWTSS